MKRLTRPLTRLVEHPFAGHLALLVNRVALGAMFGLAGVRKIQPTDPSGMGQRLSSFAQRVAGDAPLPEFLGLAYGYALPWVEVVAGFLLAIGLFTRTSAAVIALITLSILIATGVNWWPAQGVPFSTNVILLTLAVLLAVKGPGRLGVDERMKA